MRAVRLGVFLAALFSSAAALAQPIALSGSAVIGEVNGTVRVQSGNNNSPRLAVKGESLAPGTLIFTASNASVVLAFTDGQLVALGESTRFRIVDYRFDAIEVANSGVFLSLIEGSARLVMGAIGQYDPKLVRIQVGTGTVAGVPDPGGARGDAGLVVKGATTLLEVAVASGRVSLTLPSGGTTEIVAGQGALVRADGAVAQGSIALINALAGQTEDGKAMLSGLKQVQSFPMPAASAVTQILLAAQTGRFVDERQLPPPGTPATIGPTTVGTGSGSSGAGGGGSAPVPDSRGSTPVPGPATFSVTTATTGAGSGGPPCTASCN